MRVIRRSLGMRLLSVGSAALFAALEIYHLATGGALLSVGGIVLGALLLTSAGAALLNLGDRFRIDAEGIAYANPLLRRLGLRLERQVAWSDVVSVRTHRSLSHGAREEEVSALFLDLASGSRFVIDSVEEMEEVRRLVAEHTRPR